MGIIPDSIRGEWEERAIREAWADAQSAFGAMIDSGVYADPTAPETMAYVAAERELDRLLDWAQAAAKGDHHVYPNGVGR